MTDQPNPSPTGPMTPQDADNWQDYAGAMRTIRTTRRLFLLLLVLSLFVHGAAYGLGRWTRILSATETVQQEVESPSPEGAPGTIELQEPAERFSWTYYVVEMVLPLSEFIGQLSCGVLLMCYLLAANVALSGRLGGVRGSLTAFFWMLVVLALLFPWHRWMGQAIGDVQIPGVYLAFQDVIDVPAEFAGRKAEVIHYVRYLGYPLIVLLMALVGDRRYAKGYRLAQRQVEARLQVRAA